jgi:N-methylhydantoinase A/oxoprolinase/acetone carboxylase beta subunit
VTRVGVDTGGTFTDVVSEDGRVAKVPSTPHDPALAVATGVDQVGRRPAVLAHGTTVATNALLERKGGRVALLTTAGFADIIEIARQRRPSLYDQWADRPEPLVPRDLRLEWSPGQGSDVPRVPGGVDAVAVCLLHADLDQTDEAWLGARLRWLGFDVTCSHEVSPEFREYERTVTTVANAYLRPVCRRYLRALAPLADEVLVLTSSAGLVAVADAADRPVSLLLSGPAGGVLAAAATATGAGYPDAVTFDMGGTSTDVCLVLGGVPEPAAQRSVAGFPIRMPSLDVHTIGAGGGSIARIDAGGSLVVGPQSAGAVPGPACYGHGGQMPTVTDADLVLGRIPSSASFPGLGVLDARAARSALERAGLDAAGVVTVVDANMVQAVRAVSVERGVDPRRLALVAFGGAGPLHACALASALEMAAVIVPPRAGVLSAVGLLTASRQVDVVMSWPTPADHTGLVEALSTLTETASSQLDDDVKVETLVDCRYAGQSHELSVPSVAAFGAEHERRNGYSRPGTSIEVVALRASARVAPAPLSLAGVDRRPTSGPCVLAEEDCTVWVPEGWVATVHESGSWILVRGR